jgi:hypothetical protein
VKKVEAPIGENPTLPSPIIVFDAMLPNVTGSRVAPVVEGRHLGQVVTST